MSFVRRLNERLKDRHEHLVTIVVQQLLFFVGLSLGIVVLVRPGSSRAFIAWELPLLLTLAFMGWAVHRYSPSRAEIAGGLFVVEQLPRLMITLADRSGLAERLELDPDDVAVLERQQFHELDWSAEVVRLVGYARRRPSQLTQLIIGFVFFGIGAHLGAWVPEQFPSLERELRAFSPAALVFVVAGPLTISSAIGIAINRVITKANEVSLNHYRNYVVDHWAAELAALQDSANTHRRRSLRRLFSLAATAARVGPSYAGQLAALGVLTPVFDLPRFDGGRRWYDHLPSLVARPCHAAVQAWERVSPPTISLFTISVLQLHYGIYLSTVLPPMFG